MATFRGFVLPPPREEAPGYEAPGVAPGAGLSSLRIRRLQCPEVTWRAPYPPNRLSVQEARLAEELISEQKKSAFPGGKTHPQFMVHMWRLQAEARTPEVRWSFWAGIGLAGTAIVLLATQRSG